MDYETLKNKFSKYKQGQLTRLLYTVQTFSQLSASYTALAKSLEGTTLAAGGNIPPGSFH